MGDSEGGGGLKARGFNCLRRRLRGWIEEDYKKLGYSDNWINQRVKSIEIRKELTDERKESSEPKTLEEHRGVAKQGRDVVLKAD